VTKTQKIPLCFKCSLTKVWQSVPTSSLKVQRLLWSAFYFNSKGGIAQISVGVGAMIIKEEAAVLLQDPQNYDEGWHSEENQLMLCTHVSGGLPDCLQVQG